jgi:hypothetical protein
MRQAGAVPSKYCANVESVSGPPSPPSDPVFGMFYAHRRTSQIELRRLLAAASRGHARAPIACAERAAILALLKFRPTTLDGFAAWLAYLGGPKHAVRGYSDSVFVNAIESGDDDVAAVAAGFMQHAALVFRELVSPWLKSVALSSGPPTSSACPSAR